jgi:hypothetical protein
MSFDGPDGGGCNLEWRIFDAKEIPVRLRYHGGRESADNRQQSPWDGWSGI